ncbi:MAG TPA: SDR family NAD(P)-dependent oxidoreductase [Pseudonocardiaceae bacterium]|nr:SDR family NAD(P)-dependent oxidoreductase [Pseudonocardiaceae bacterium]
MTTGVFRWIGAAAAELFTARGGHAILVARSAEQVGEGVERTMSTGGPATAFAADLADVDEIHALADSGSRGVRLPDVLVNGVEPVLRHQSWR